MNGYITRISIWWLGIISTQKCERINSLPLEHIHYSVCIMYIPEHRIIGNTTIVRVESFNLRGLMVDEHLPNAAHTDGVTNESVTYHDDVIKWKHFPRYWLSMWGIHRLPVNSPHKAHNAELWCFLWYAPEPTVEQILTPVIWDVFAPIMTSL